MKLSIILIMLQTEVVKVMAKMKVTLWWILLHQNSSSCFNIDLKRDMIFCMTKTICWLKYYLSPRSSDQPFESYSHSPRVSSSEKSSSITPKTLQLTQSQSTSLISLGYSAGTHKENCISEYLTTPHSSGASSKSALKLGYCQVQKHWPFLKKKKSVFKMCIDCMWLIPLYASVVQYAVEEATELPGSEGKTPTKWRSIIEVLHIDERLC